MTYVLKKITPTDQEKILRDAEGDSKKFQALERFSILKQDPDAKWAIDYERNFYLFGVHGRSENGGSYLYFFQKNRFYEIEFEGGLQGRLVKFTDRPHPTPPLLNELQQEIRDALAVYGRFGSGDGNGDWMLAVDAILEAKE